MPGWDPRPPLEQVLVWLFSIVPVGALFLLGGRNQPASAPRPPHVVAATDDAGAGPEVTVDASSRAPPGAGRRRVWDSNPR